MKIAVAQLQCKKGDIYNNISNHIELIKIAIGNKVDLIVFPELSITSYEPTIVHEINFTYDDKKLNIFQELSDKFNIIIGVGLPLKTNNGINISLMFFDKNKERQVYSKQIIHSDETPYFTEGKQQLYLNINNNKIAPAICYESMLEKHHEQVFNNGANIYLVSVAKSKDGVEKSYNLYQKISTKYTSYVLMSNLIGESDNFINYGNSGIWNKQGELMCNFDEKEEGILILDVENNSTQKIIT
jgi:predicted amidohydrolase